MHPIYTQYTSWKKPNGVQLHRTWRSLCITVSMHILCSWAFNLRSRQIMKHSVQLNADNSAPATILHRFSKTCNKALPRGRRLVTGSWFTNGFSLWPILFGQLLLHWQLTWRGHTQGAMARYENTLTSRQIFCLHSASIECLLWALLTQRSTLIQR